MGERLRAVRGKRSLRAVAAEIGIAPATLSRIENGKPCDLANFRKIAKWLPDSPASLLGMDVQRRPVVSVHFGEKPMVRKTAIALADMILRAQQAMESGR